MGLRRLHPVKTIQYKARDGLEISAVLTLPRNSPAKNLPLILMPHGGPEARDDESWDFMVQFLADRGYLPKGVPLMKRVLAVSGQTVCRTNLTITVDRVRAPFRPRRDRAGRDLPVWQGCRRIPTGEIFLMNWQVRDSLDGRYFGPTSTDHIIGRAVPLWTDEDGDGHFMWRAPTH